MEKRNILILVVLIVLVIIGFKFFGGTSRSISPAEAQAKVQKLIDMNPGNPAVIKGVVEEGGLYKITVAIEGQEFFSYISKDGKKFFPEAIDLEEIANLQENAPQAEVSQKSDKPTVELFVMSHCPYGTQIEKGILPVLDLLGDKIDFQLKFVNYAMHEKLEIGEEIQQYCIGKQNKNLLLSYLNCFLQDGNSTRCLSETTAIDKSSLQTCVTATDKTYEITKNYNDKGTWIGQYPPFNIYKDDNLKYGVEGSPTLIINGEEIASGRDSNSLLAVVCSAFNVLPSECEQELSTATPAPGFGTGTSANSTDATCN